jgi:predicted esterase
MADRWRYALCQAAPLALLGLLAGCPATPKSEPAPPTTATVQPTSGEALPAAAAPSAAPPDVPPPSLPRIDAPSGFVELEVPGFRNAVVSVPADTSRARRIVVALHGNFDRPEWQCQVWRRIIAAQDFVLCPRGIPRGDVPKEYDRWEWGSLAKTKAELVAALAALRARYPQNIASGPIVFTGFSLGAILGARLILDPELQVGAAVFTEGGFEGWTSAKAKSAASSLRYFMLGCGQTACRNAYRYQLEPLFKKAGLNAAMVADVKAGHTYDDPVAALVAAEWPKLIVALSDEAPKIP